jgi:hypothetical protein
MMQQLNAAKERLGQGDSGALLHCRAQLQEIVAADLKYTVHVRSDKAAC